MMRNFPLSATKAVSYTHLDVYKRQGLVRAKTGGGGIRVVRVSGPTDLETVGGSIYLTLSLIHI